LPDGIPGQGPNGQLRHPARSHPMERCEVAGTDGLAAQKVLAVAIKSLETERVVRIG